MLTVKAIENVKSKDKQIKLFDGGGLFLLVTPAGSKLWRLKYRFEGREKLLALGAYPYLSLADAREARGDAKKLLAKGVDPGGARKAAKAARIAEIENSFEAIAREWHGKNSSSWVPEYGDQILRRLVLDIFPIIGNRPITDLKAADVLKALQPIESRGAVETAHRVKQTIGQIFRYTVATGRAERDPTGDLKGALRKVQTSHHPAITDPEKVGALLRAIDGFDGSFIVKCALRLAPLVFVRPGELRKAEWIEIDLDQALWSIPAEKMKMKQPHLVPLSKQAKAILEELHAVTGRGQFLFINHRSAKRPMSDNAINAAFRRMGYEQGEVTAHGFRATARTLLDEVLQFRPDFIEHQLAHAVRDPNGRAYNRTAHLKERKKMMQTWADYLDGLKADKKVIPIRSRMG
jgi:integrase